ncbi:hypothetical protein ACGFX4_10135 [Kitasatospora sp. NPDC048365]|uniref:hypothetical protein n=1 Tax=Kitasatospora sp. NPDC048365 TaxID=3364050 RepID=UPI00370FFC4F
MLVDHFSRSGWVAEFDAGTGAIGGHREASAGERTSGRYEVLGDTPVVLYREAGHLVLRIGVHRVEFEKARIRHRIGERHCSLLVNEVTVRYPIPDELYDLADDLTPFVEAEHFDFGLFLAEIARDTDRAARILQ